MSSFQDRFDPAVWRVVANTRPGQILSYGAVARLAGFPRHARMVSRAMSRSPEPLPWYRIIRADHRLAFEPGSAPYRRQRKLLEAEGVLFCNGRAQGREPDRPESLDELLWGPGQARGVSDGR